MLTEEKLYNILVEVSGVSDFHLELKPVYSKTYWGRYFPKKSLIRLYALKECGEQYPDEDLIREGLHELTHHIQYHHVPFWTRKKGVMHDYDFWELYNRMLKSYFKGESKVKKYEVEITETLKYKIEVEAESEAQAVEYAFASSQFAENLFQENDTDATQVIELDGQ